MPAEISGTVAIGQVAATVATGRTEVSQGGNAETIGDSTGTGSIGGKGETNGGAKDETFAAGKAQREKLGGVVATRNHLLEEEEAAARAETQVEGGRRHGTEVSTGTST